MMQFISNIFKQKLQHIILLYAQLEANLLSEI